ncbi:MAG: hypothetical protein JOZ87_10180 [Chloroflexi bacterium]|nr:hypothetical protein [Chloroflexota bacterium]
MLLLEKDETTTRRRRWPQALTPAPARSSATVASLARRAAAPSTLVGGNLVAAVIVGVNLGPNLTTIGTLATMLWLLLLRRRGLQVSALEYVRSGVIHVIDPRSRLDLGTLRPAIGGAGPLPPHQVEAIEEAIGSNEIMVSHPAAPSVFVPGAARLPVRPTRGRQIHHRRRAGRADRLAAAAQPPERQPGQRGVRPRLRGVDATPAAHSTRHPHRGHAPRRQPDHDRRVQRDVRSRRRLALDARARAHGGRARRLRPVSVRSRRAVPPRHSRRSTGARQAC